MAELTPLSQWLLRRPDRVVALRADGPLRTPAFVARVDAWMTALARRPGQRFALYHHDNSEFLAILFALWQLRRIACIASDNGPGSVTQLQGLVDGFIGEFPTVADRLDRPADENPAPPEWQSLDSDVLDSDVVALEVYTSGSSGAPKAIAKTLAQLQAELSALELLWPGIESSVVLSTVTHHHFYGLVIALLWPFSAGRAIETRLCEYPEDIIHRAAGHARFSLVSSPSHLARLSPALNWQSLAGRCDHVLSSAAPLRRDDSLAAAALLGTPVREIYGSTETGAIAWRCQQAEERDALWQALPGVRLAPSAQRTPTTETTLSVRAPWLDADELVLPDRVEFDEPGCFRLLGRLDRIVKVEGKRISLAAIERLLDDHEWAEDVRALTLERSRVETAVVMKLSVQGEKQLQQAGRKGLIQCFRILLGGQFEAVLMPRRWRFVEQMPVNRQGKLPLKSLLALFDREAGEWPQILERQLVDGKLIVRCRIPPQLIYFDGHMEGRPILPGIVQVHWAEAFARRWLPVAGRFECLEKVKFQKVILPHYDVWISLDYDPSSRKLNFCFESERGVHSSGRICFSN
jgi:acyl-CoA synthetase (AMP-forming)/AMP-acid ligase II